MADHRSLRITSFAVWGSGADTGVGRKLIAQVDAWKTAGHDPLLVVLSRSRAWPERSPGGVSIRAFPCGNLLSVWSAAHAARAACAAHRPQVIYQRQTLWFPGLGGLCRDAPSIVEIQTDDLAELARFRWKGPICRLTRGIQLGRCAAHVYVTDELRDRPSYQRFAKPATVIANPLPEVEPLPPRSEAGNPAPRLVFLATPGFPWHGTDKVLTLAAANPDWRIDLIGSTREQLPAPPPANVVVHGYLDSAAYRAVLRDADVAIGSLALHRNGMNEACPLKVREYLALGLPTITAFIDPDLREPQPFLLRLPNQEDNVATHLDQVRAFVARWQGRRFDPTLVAHLASGAKELARLAFMHRFARTD